MTAPAPMPQAEAPHPEQAAWAPWLDAGERLLWVGEPERGFLTRGDRRALIIAAPGALGLLVLMALPGIGGGSDAGGIFIFAVFSVCALGLGGWRFLDRVLRRGTRYALTDRRAKAARSWPTRKLRAIPLEAGAAPRFQSGSGQILFGDPPPRGKYSALNRLMWRKPWLKFEDLADARPVFSLAAAAASARRALAAGPATRNGSAPT